ncbi:Os05g0571501 [Oryza sativa Japonica Group]|uniref:Os05g0571501 protein n=2 Tax=Oryza TaxID=4527 RepID=A0A0N7KLA0_ORYSJ|nr:Os05g0571501 [Oryza sativa Japonica Group]
MPTAEPTLGSSLPLSSIDNNDKIVAVCIFVDFIQVFPSVSAEAVEDQAASVVHHYPVVSRIMKPIIREPEIDSTSEGVWFIEAEANYTSYVDSVLTADGTVEI